MSEQVIKYNRLLKPITLNRIVGEIKLGVDEPDYEHALYLCEMYLCQYLQRLQSGEPTESLDTVEKVLSLFGLSLYVPSYKEQDRCVKLNRNEPSFEWFVTYSLPEGRVRKVITTVYANRVNIKTTETPERNRRRWKDLPPELKAKLRVRYGYSFD